MALISPASPSHCIRAESVQCTAGNNLFYGVSQNMETSKLKGTSFGLRSLSWNSLKTMQALRVDGGGVGCKRGHQVIVAASPPTEDAVVATEPLTKEDLVAYLASGCKSKEKWRFNF